MRCPRCTGCVYQNWSLELDTIQRSCLNCGWAENPRVFFGHVEETRTKCYNCASPPTPGLSQCERCRTMQTAYKQRKRQSQKQAAA